MNEFPVHACLEPEVLAAYADHGLSLAERARVEAHLAACPHCTAVLAGAIRTVAALAPATHEHGTEDATPLVSRRSVRGMAAAAAAVLVVLAVPPLLGPRLQRDTGLVSLAGSVGEHRSVLGRLTGGIPHAPLAAPSAGGQGGRAAGTDRVLLTSGRIRGSFGERVTASQLHAAGVRNLLSRRYDDAARLLVAASREQPANARYLNDLATVHLERARLGLRPDDVPRALAAADRAARLDPSLQEAWFNRALAVSALSLTDQARVAWTEYLKRDSSSPWAGEARQKLEELARPSPAAAWATIEARLRQSISPASADEAVRTQTTEARNFIENELFVEWANAVLAGGEGSTELERLRTMADAMLRVAGDALYSNAVDAIGLSNPQQSRALAAAHIRFAEASRLFGSDRYADADAEFTRAEEVFASNKSPFAARAAADLGATNYVANNYGRALAKLASARNLADAHGYVYVKARTSWFEGMIAFAQGRVSDAQSHYEDALATFERAGDVEHAVGAHSLLAALHFYLGNKPEEWRHHHAALQGVSVSRSARLRFRTYLAAAASLRFDDPETALLMQDQALDALEGSSRNASILEVLASRARTLIALGRLSDAERTIASARRELAAVADTAFRELLELVILSAEGELRRRKDPAAAVATAQRALGLIARRNNAADRSRLPRFHLQLAKANIVMGRLDEADRALDAGIREFERERSMVTDEGAISVFDENWELFETGVQLAIRKGDYDRAFALAERARARSIAEARRGAQPRSLAAVRAGLDADVALVALNQFENEMSVWVIRRDAVAVSTRPLRREDARRLVSRQQEEIWRESTATVAGRDLYDVLIRPIASHLRGVSRVIFVPDLTYENTAFAALWDANRGQFLVEDVSVGVAPSADLFVSASAAARDARSGEPLIVGGAALAAAAEAETIASLYPASRVITGAAATSTGFLNDAAKHSVVHVVAETAPNQAHPLLARVMLADQPGRRHSGAVLGREIAARPLSTARLVVLDELRTNSEQRGEGTLNLARAFIAAGVPAVVGTLPGAHEQATRDLMIGFHREMTTGNSPGQALLRVQRNALQQNGRRLGAWTALVLYGSDR